MIATKAAMLSIDAELHNIAPMHITNIRHILLQYEETFANQ